MKSQVLSETSNISKDVPKALLAKEVNIILEGRNRIFVIGPADEKDQIFIRLLKDDYFYPNFFQVKLTLKALYSKNNRFKSLHNLEEVSKYFMNLIEAKNVEIGPKKSEDEIIISFYLPEIPTNIKVDFVFKKESFNLKEYKNQVNRGLTEIKRNINEFKLKYDIEVDGGRKSDGGSDKGKKKKDKKDPNVTYNDFKNEINSLMNLIADLKVVKKAEEKDSSADEKSEGEGH